MPTREMSVDLLVNWMDGGIDLAIAVVARIVADPPASSRPMMTGYAARIGRSLLRGLLPREEDEITIRPSLFFQPPGIRKPDREVLEFLGRQDELCLNTWCHYRYNIQSMASSPLSAFLSFFW